MPYSKLLVKNSGPLLTLVFATGTGLLDTLHFHNLGRDLTLSKTTNFRLFKTERACRQQFRIWRKRQKVLQTGLKGSGKRKEKFLLFSVFKKTCTADTSKQGLVWERVNAKYLPNNKILYPTKLTLYQATNLDSFKLKKFADNNFEVDKNGREITKRVENTEGKEEISL